MLNSWSLESGLLEYEAASPCGGSVYSPAPTQLLKVRLLDQYRLALVWPYMVLFIVLGILDRPLFIRRKMETFKYGDRVQVFDLIKFKHLGWGSVTETYITIPNKGINKDKKRQAVLVCLDTGESVYIGGASHIALSKERAVEIADRMLKDIKKEK